MCELTQNTICNFLYNKPHGMVLQTKRSMQQAIKAVTVTTAMDADLKKKLDIIFVFGIEFNETSPR